MAGATATLLLPPPARLGGGTLDASLARALGRGNRKAGDAGEQAQMLRHFELLPVAGRWRH